MPKVHLPHQEEHGGVKHQSGLGQKAHVTFDEPPLGACVAKVVEHFGGNLIAGPAHDFQQKHCHQGAKQLSGVFLVTLHGGGKTSGGFKCAKYECEQQAQIENRCRDAQHHANVAQILRCCGASFTGGNSKRLDNCNAKLFVTCHPRYKPEQLMRKMRPNQNQNRYKTG